MCYSHSVHIVSWEDESLTLRDIRTEVFINEQQVPEAMEWDEFDVISTHVLARNFDGLPVGTARLLPDGHIGRMAVLKGWRSKGYGCAMLQKLLEELSNRHEQKVMLNAQTSAVKFYEKFGFKVSGEEFWEAGILHVKMILLLK
ncbi:MAG: GNAT family N-acetyltransferase [Nitrosomonas sp.]|jgi:predicted GNAT family N-acyltransferase|uniref:GNAT family N-acetyltransferase n=1 Tax=Nitrosomonas sp. TaxID=42353 RepID=UPI002728B16E|nr:GNAT family N-acetyltransferase [Nitrosomonas sp.]MDO9470128.1 GNAT family N-acetyltransferase [Nitrosomonas sp.]MDP1548781.1 GNAT family N-acetyltransferase [Nitrosomonas sp.]MDP1788337.1 GNAT family N-acetyltransferase [Nitrosomonas sp.]MDP1933309.1 GNAT family N-acetyltransferase [Nitrosomonas sp.]MDP2223068.1 GNAT family N-acetyltransferase [Nitrosomonas sp.]